METASSDSGITIRHPAPASEDVLSREALAFVGDLHRRFDARRRHMCAQRAERREQYHAGKLPGFLPQTRHFRNAIWETDPVPAALRDRRTELVVASTAEGLASSAPARAVIADFSGATSPRFEAVIAGQRALKSATDRKGERVPIFVRPRPLAMDEVHLEAGGAALSASLFDIGMHWFHTGAASHASGEGPYYYLCGIEHHLEVRLWRDIITHLEQRSGFGEGQVRVGVVIDTVPAAFQMDEILFELRRHAAGLAYDRLGLIASYIECFGRRTDRILAPWTRLGMDEGFLNTIRLRMVETCHRRRTHAIAGHGARGLTSDDPDERHASSLRLRSRLARDIGCGYDGTLVSSVAAARVASEVFDVAMPGPHQILAQRHYPRIAAEAMLQPCSGPVEREDIEEIVLIGVRQLTAWLDGHSVDMSCLEVCRAQIWQWLGAVRLTDGVSFDHSVLDSACRAASASSGDSGERARIFFDAVTSAANRPLNATGHGPG